ncbi:MAG TPA: hypothetical protein VGH96_20180 [Streptosporangiaceae bacterium]
MAPARAARRLVKVVRGPARAVRGLVKVVQGPARVAQAPARAVRGPPGPARALPAKVLLATARPASVPPTLPARGPRQPASVLTSMTTGSLAMDLTGVTH